MTTATVGVVAAAIVLAAVHLLAGRLRFLDRVPRSRWLSFAGGVSLAYVFVHLLPELETKGAELAGSGVLAGLSRQAYLMALAGIVAFYGLERAARVSRARRRQADADGEVSAGPAVFWLHVASFAVYNALIGALLVRKAEDLVGLGVYVAAMALHFVVTDAGLRSHHQARYDRRGRFVLVAAILAGPIVGWSGVVPPVASAALFSVLAGAVMLNAIKEELPAERESRFGVFALGAGGYAALLMTIV